MTAHDRGRLHGREADVVRLFGALDPARPVILAAPSGTGKTSLLCAGLIPYLDAKGIDHLYLACRPDEAAQLPQAIWPGAATASAALAARHAARDRRLVLILDQVESLLRDATDGQAFLGELLDRRVGGADVAILLAVREDFVARLVAASATLTDGVPQVRLPPLDRDGARAALLAPLAEHEVELAPDLLAVVLDNLIRAGGELGAAFGWGDGPAVYPPHLQLIGEALWSARGAREAELTLAHYQRIGGLDAILAGHLDRKLATLSEADRAIARDLFLSLVASAQTRAVRSEAELLGALGGRHRTDAVQRVLVLLEQARLVIRRAAGGGVTWELLHDSLVPHIEAWIGVHDAERRQVAEMLRFHLLQSRSHAEDPALLSARQLRRVDRFPGLVDELDLEWARRPAVVWTPRSLTARSRRAVRVRRGIAAVGVLAVLAAVGLLIVRWRQGAREDYLRDRDLGRVELSFTVFDWEDRGERGWAPVPIDPAAIPDLEWSLHDPALDDRDSPGRAVPSDRVRRGRVSIVDRARVEIGIDVRGGDGFLIITGRGRAGEACGPSIIPVAQLPGYATRGQDPPRLQLHVPSCEASRFDTIEIPSGPFLYGGTGEPPSSFPARSLPPEEQTLLEAYRIDRTEITNAAFQVFANMGVSTSANTIRVHDIVASAYPDSLAMAGGATYPRTDLDWFDARAYCRFMGKELPTSRQWQKALRGGPVLPDGSPNPYPRRNLPWGAEKHPPPAAIAHSGFCTNSASPCSPSPVAARDLPHEDRSPYGVDDLAGTVQEWMADDEPGSEELPFSRRPRLTRGGNWASTTPESLVDYMVTRNPRPVRRRDYELGARCVLGGDS